MREPTDKRVQKFLDEIQEFDQDQHVILQHLRQEVIRLNPKVSERMMYGGIMFSLEGEDFGGIFAYKKHVSFEFSAGAQMQDPDQLLEGQGKFRRHLKFVSPDQVSAKNITFFVQQALSMVTLCWKLDGI